MNCCPACGAPLEIKFNEYHKKDMYYCTCGWDEEDGGNYVSINMESI